MPQEIVSQFDRKYGLPIETNRSVQNISQRNAIPESVRWEGMIVHVLGDQSYILLNVIDNTGWEPLGGLVNVNVVDNLLSTSATDALSANQGRVLSTTKLDSVVGGTNVTIDDTDPLNPIINASGGGAVDSVFGRTGDVTAQVGDYSSFYLGLTAKAADSDLLDGIGSSKFVQTTGAQGIMGLKTHTANGIRLNDNVPISFGDGGAESSLYSNGNHTFLDLGNGAFFIRDGTTQRYFFAPSGDFSASARITAANFDASSTTPLIRLGNTAINQSESGRIRFTETIANGNQGFYLHYDGSTNVFAVGRNADNSTDIDVMTIDRASGYVEFASNVEAASFVISDWQIVQSGTTLQFKYGGVTKFEMNSNGIMEGTDFKQGL